MLCSISQRVPQHPVVSAKSGYLFERSLIEAYIAEHGRCPVTGESLQPSDLVDLRSAPPASTTAAGGSLGAASVPAILERLQVEWDQVMMEQFTLRQEVTQLQHELSHALQRYEAACRVIAKLRKDSDNAEAGKKSEAVDQGFQDEEGASAVVVPAAVQVRMDEMEAAERRRRKEQKSSTAPHFHTVGSLAPISQCPVNPTHSGALCVAFKDNATLFASFAAGDHHIVSYSVVDGEKRSAMGVGHTQAIHTLAMAGDEDGLLLSASEDATIRVWKPEAEQLHCTHTLRYAGGVVAMARRTVAGSYALSGSADGSLSLSDIHRGEHVVVTSSSTPYGALTCIEIHPYTTLAAVGTASGAVQLWDLKRMQSDTIIRLPSSVHGRFAAVCSVSLSNDCFSMAVGCRDGTAYVWDLRRLETPLELLTPSSSTQSSVPAAVRYAPSGRLLAVAGADLFLYEAAEISSEKNEPLARASASPNTPAGAVYRDVCWSGDGLQVAGAAMDGAVRVFKCEAS